MDSSTGEIFGPSHRLSTFAEILRWRARHWPSRRIYTFLRDGEVAEATLNYQELDRRARAIGALLQSFARSGERVLLLYPPGLEFIASFFGCLYAGMIAVPAYPPGTARTLPRLNSMMSDARPSVALTTSSVLGRMESLSPERLTAHTLRWVSTSGLDERLADDWHEPPSDGNTLAFIQYTSGSTARPRGVMLSHRNLLYNSALIAEVFNTGAESVGVSWLPPYHDMGLIGQVLNPLYVGAQMFLMSPGAFLQRPHCWLRAISECRATHSGGPNFAYDLCVQKVTPEQRETLDLSSWRVAFNGAEPVRRATLDSFAETFAPCGFRPGSFFPCYGLAEATLMVSCKRGDAPPAMRTLTAAKLERNRLVASPAGESGTRTLIGSGRPLAGQQIVIIDPATLTRSPPHQVGEIWVSGPSVARGYWNSPAETEAQFGAYLSDTGAGPFLRTGDLGFIDGGELFVTGRLKDLMIICGRNIYPQDIELSAGRSHDSLRQGHGAAFTVECDGEEQLVVVQELKFRARPDAAEVSRAVRRAVADEHGLQASAIVLLKPGGLSKTSSGKVQRHACKAAFLTGTLEVYGAAVESGRQTPHQSASSQSRPPAGTKSG